MKKLILTGIATIALAVLSAQANETCGKSCAACHGKDGKPTKAGEKIGAKDFSDAKVQEALKDEEMTKAIKEGVKDGSKTKMKAFADLKDDEIKALVAHVRSFKK